VTSDHALGVTGDERQLYERTKRDLASQTWKYVQDYADAKSEGIGQIIYQVVRRTSAISIDGEQTTRWQHEVWLSRTMILLICPVSIAARPALGIGFTLSWTCGCSEISHV
jgi:hypothetical protein